MAAPAAIGIGRRRPAIDGFLGLKVFSSLQGLAGEVLTICKRGVFGRKNFDRDFRKLIEKKRRQAAIARSQTRGSVALLGREKRLATI